MVAFFSGVGAGFERSSYAALGSGGLLGSASLGRGGEKVFLNVGTGNLLVSRQDEYLVGRGPDVAISRTYNSLGALDENGDYWRQSTDRRVYGLTGTVNTSGSTVKRVSADGSEITYAWNGSFYAATNDAGAPDTLTYSGGDWTWLDANTRVTETYKAAQGGWISEQIDTDGNKLTFAYVSAGKLSGVTNNQDGSHTDYTWSGNNITSVSTTGANGTLTRTAYAYDGQSRLIKVTVGGVYETNYSYVSTSNRISAIWQTDGSRVDFTYILDGSTYRISQIIQTVGPGDTRTTTIAYFSDRREITDPRGQVTKLYIDGSSQLTQITAPPAHTGATPQTVQFLYNGSGDVTRITDALGGQTNYVYDASSNTTRITDATGNITDRAYDAKNSLILETRTGSFSGGASGSLYSRFVYDTENHLRYAIDAEGRVTEYRYTTPGQLQFRLAYTQNLYSIGSTTPSLATMDAWRDAIADRTLVKNFEYRYDTYGNLNETIGWGYSTTAGNPSASDGYHHQLFAYDQYGRLLSRYTAGEYAETFVYDHLDRVTASVDLAGGTTTIVFNDPGTTTTVTTASGYTTLSTYNKAGELISRADSGAYAFTGTRTHLYDKNGQLRKTVDATGLASYFLYDKTGRKIADIGHGGQVVEYRYDQANRQVATAYYTVALTAQQVTDLSNTGLEIEINSIRPTAHSYDIWQWSIYDAAGRVIETIMGDGSATRYEYDQAGRLVTTTGYYNKLSQVSGFIATTPTSLTLPSADSRDVIVRTFYDRDGRVIGSLNGVGHLSRVLYDGAGQKVQEIAYANPTQANLRPSGTFDQLLASFTHDASKDISTRYIYDGQGFLRWTVDALNRVTEYVYWDGAQHLATGTVRKTIVYAAPIAVLGAYNRNTMVTAVASLAGNSNNRISYNVYNARQQLTYIVDATGAVTGFTYDIESRVIRKTQYAATATMTSMGAEWQWSGNLDIWAASNGANARITRNYYSVRGDLRFTIDAEGYACEYHQDAEGRIFNEYHYSTKLSPTDAWTIGTVDGASKGTYTAKYYRYDNMGRLVDIYDGNGTINHYGYYHNGKQAWDSRAIYQGNDGAWHLLAYDQAGRLMVEYFYINEVWGAHTTKTYSYDGLGNLASVTDGNGNTTSYTYDKAGRVVTQTAPLGVVTTFEYDAFGRGVKATDANGNSSYSYFDQAGRVTLAIDAEGYATQTTYTAFGEVDTVTRRYTKTTGASVGSPPSISGHGSDAATSFLYDKLSRVTRTTDAEGYYEQYTLNSFGERTAVRNKLGGWTYNEYEKRGQLTQETLPIGAHRADGSLQTANIVNRFEYDSRGNRTRMIEAYGLTEQRTTTFGYDLADRLVSKTGDAIGVATSALAVTTTITPTEYFNYDRRGNLIEKRDAAGARTLFWYDKLDRVTHTLSALGTLTRNIYDNNGNITETRVFANQIGLPVDATGVPPADPGAYRVTQFTYDALNRMTQSITPNILTGAFDGSFGTTTANLTATYQYDAMSNVIKVTDPNGRSVHSYYDKLGRKIAQVDQEHFRTDWTHNTDGNVTREHRWANRLTATPTTTFLPTATASGEDRITDFTYDRMGRRSTETRLYVLVHDGAGAHTSTNSVVSYLYNGLGEVTRKTEATNEYIDYAYDIGGRMTSEQRSAFVDFNGQSVNPKVDYYYNGLSDLSISAQRGATGALDRVTTYTYGPGGRLLVLTDAEGFTRTYEYDATGRTSREYYYRVTPGGTATEAIAYDYDLEGRVTQQGVAAYIGGWTWNYADRMTTHYNVFGEVSERGLNGVYAEKFEYDNAGRVWRTTSGDGTTKYFLYDKAGNQTLTIASDGMDIDNQSIAWALGRWASPAAIGNTYVDGVVAMITRYDYRGQAIEALEPRRELKAAVLDPQTQAQTAAAIIADLLTQRAYNAFGEVAYEINAGGYRIDYAYNTTGRMIRTESPTVLVTYENGGQASLRPTDHRYYDAAGRLVASRDANGNLTRMTLLSGTGYGGSQAQAVTVTTADNAVVTSYYDIHGDARAVTDQIGRTAWQAYDRLGRVIQVNNPVGLIDYYAYDGLGQRIRHYNNLLGYGNSETTTFDAQGRVTQQVAMGGDVTSTSYSWAGGISTSGMGTFGGWQETTIYANGKTLSEFTDQFGRTLGKYDMSSRYSGFIYDKAGRLVQRAGGETLNFSYLNTGRVDATYTFTGSYASDNWIWKGASYGYDQVGNVTSQHMRHEQEIYYYQDGWWEWVEGDPKTGGGYSVWHEGEWIHTFPFANFSTATAAYDGLGRMTSWTEAGTQHQPAASITYSYDANGNIRRSYASFMAYNTSGATATTPTTQDFWYRYDSLNRVVTQKGQFTGSSIIRGATGQDIFYDLAGQRAFVWNSNNTRDDYTYDVGGRLTQVRVNNSGTSGPGAVRSNIAYDVMGRMTSQMDYRTDGVAAYHRWVTYNDKSQIVTDNQGTLRTTGPWVDFIYTTNDYTLGGYALGSVVRSTSQYETNSGGVYRTSRTDMQYDWWEGAQQSYVSYIHDINVGTSTSSTYAYTNIGGQGQLTGVAIADGRPRQVWFLNDMMGQAFYREEGDNNPSQLDPRENWYRFAGKQMAYIGNNGTLDTAYHQSVANRQQTPGSGAFRFGATPPAPHSDFDQSVSSISSYNLGSSAGGYTVRSGETLSSIAANLWGDGSLWYKLAAANGLSGQSALIEGQTITIPAGVMKSGHNAGTFMPYDPADTIGDTGPSTPIQPKPKKNKCGTFGQILLAVIATAVTAFLAPYATHALGPIVGGAAAGAAGSAASQYVGVQTGIQDKFSWNQVGMAALEAGISGGLADGPLPGKDVGSSVIRGMLSSAGAQILGGATGMKQDKFSWSGVAAAGVISAIGAAPGFNGPAGPILKMSAKIIAGAATMSLIDGTDFGDNVNAVLPSVIGSTIGEAIAEGIEEERFVREKFRERYQIAQVGSGGPLAYQSSQRPLGWLSDAINSVGDFISNVGDFLGFDGAFGFGDPGYDGDKVVVHGSFAGQAYLAVTDGPIRDYFSYYGGRPPRDAPNGHYVYAVDDYGRTWPTYVRPPTPAPLASTKPPQSGPLGLGNDSWRRMQLSGYNPSNPNSAKAYFYQVGTFAFGTYVDGWFNVGTTAETATGLMTIPEAAAVTSTKLVAADFVETAGRKGLLGLFARKGTAAADNAVAAAEAVIPRGFASADEFARFGSNLRGGLSKAGYADANAVLQGSAVTGKNFKTGAAFDIGRVSDFDVALSGDSLFQAAKNAGIALRSAGTRTGPLTARDLKVLGLRDLSVQMRLHAGRPVNFMIYRSTESAVQRAPSIVLPR